MLSHTVPKNLIEHFAYHDKSTRSMRLRRYQKGKAPYGRAAPKHATSWDGHFADPKNKDRELAIELRLKQQFEDPVNMFIEELQHAGFGFTPERVRLLGVHYDAFSPHAGSSCREPTPAGADDRRSQRTPVGSSPD